MNLGQALKMAFKSLKSNKMRSFLTMLGVIIGVVAVSLLTTVTQAAKDTVVNQLKRESQVVMLMMMSNGLTPDKVDNIAINMKENGAGEFEYAYIYSKTSSVDKDSNIIDAVEYNEETASYASVYQRAVPLKSTIKVVSENYFNVRNIELYGESISKENSNYCVIDQEFADAFLGETEDYSTLVGKEINLGGDSTCEVVTVSLDSNRMPATSEEEIALKLVACASEAEALHNILYISYINMYQLSFPKYNEENMFVVSGEGEGAIFSLVLNLPIIYNFTDSSLESDINDKIETSLGDSYLGQTATVSSTTDFTGGQNYIISGVIKSESDLFGTGFDSSRLESYKNDPQMRIVFEQMNRQPVGNAYVLDSEYSNEFVLNDDGSAKSLDGAHFKFADESNVADGSAKIMIELIHEGFGVNTFMVISMQAIAGVVDQVMNIMQILLGVIAGISLVVGGIGIMNIMLVVVTERTREIGIRKAIGAKRSSILVQFLIESLIITLLGGFIGILISEIGALVIGYFMGIVMFLPWWVILISVGFCALIGVGFGMYPAIKASKLHPIDALRRD